MDGGERFIRDDKGNIASSGYVDRFTNSLIITVISTYLAVAMGTVTV
jgi:multiple sugar transport system permease protein